MMVDLNGVSRLLVGVWIIEHNLEVLRNGGTRGEQVYKVELCSMSEIKVLRQLLDQLAVLV